MLGICTRYARTDAAYFALRIADWAEETGREATLFSVTASPQVLDAPWDRVVVRPQHQIRFTDWAKQCDRLIWTHVPNQGQVAWARNRGIRTALVFSWHEVDGEDRPALKEFDVIYVPGREVARYLQNRWQLTRVSQLPWDNGLPITRKDPRITSKYRYLFLPLFDGIPDRSENTVVDLAARLLAAFDDTVLTVVYNASTLGTIGSRRLRRYAKHFGQRLRLVPNVSPAARCLYYREHDLTLYPVHADDWGMPLIDSFTMGTPVVAFSFPPLSDMMLGTNSLVVPCETRTGPTGMPQPVTDFVSMEKNLLTLLRDRDELDILQSTVSHGLTQRRAVFDDVLTRFMK